MNKHGYYLALYGLILLLLSSGCVGPEKPPEPDNLIDERNYVDLLVEMQHITTYRDAQPDSVDADSLKKIIYEKFGITEEQFLTTHEYYQKHVEEQLIRVNEAIRQLENEEQFIESHIDSIKAMRRDTTGD